MTKKMLSATMIGAGALAATLAPAHAAEVHIQAQNPVIEIAVTEQVLSPPDTAKFSTGVETKASTATEALRQNSRAAQQVVDKLRALGIAARDIQTTGINLNADYRYDNRNNQNRFVGYRASNQVSVTLRDIDRLGPVLDALVADGGATNLNGPYFSLDDDSAAKKTARRRALQAAEAQALDYAGAAGYGNVRILQIQEAVFNQGRMPPMPVARMDNVSVQASMPPPPVSPGEVGTSISLAITFEMMR